MSNIDWREQLKVLDVYITNQCQAGCPSCGRFEDFFKTPFKTCELLSMEHVPYETVIRWIKNNIPHGKDYKIKLCGEFGDPMMHPQIFDIIRYVRHRQENTVLVHTNGGLRNKDFYVKLAETLDPFGHLVFSIDGTTAEVNDLYRKRVNFERAMDNMITFAEHCHEGGCSWDFLIFDWNWQQIPEAARIAKQYNIGIDFKFQDREYGLIADANISKANDMIEQARSILQ